MLMPVTLLWLMLTVRDAIPKARELATAEFATLRLRLLKIAARVVETTSRVRLAFAAASPEADLFRSLPARAASAWSLTGGACAPVRPTHPSSALQSTGRHRR
jgi:Transposase DDE domain group 1